MDASSHGNQSGFGYHFYLQRQIEFKRKVNPHSFPISTPHSPTASVKFRLPIVYNPLSFHRFFFYRSLFPFTFASIMTLREKVVLFIMIIEGLEFICMSFPLWLAIELLKFRCSISLDFPSLDLHHIWHVADNHYLILWWVNNLFMQHLKYSTRTILPWSQVITLSCPSKCHVAVGLINILILTWKPNKKEPHTQNW